MAGPTRPSNFPPWGASWSALGRLRGILGASWSVLGASWGALGRLGSVLRASWSVLGASWRVLARLVVSWGYLGTPLGTFWGVLGCIREYRKTHMGLFREYYWIRPWGTIAGVPQEPGKSFRKIDFWGLQQFRRPLKNPHDFMCIWIVKAGFGDSKMDPRWPQDGPKMVPRWQFFTLSSNLDPKIAESM